MRRKGGGIISQISGNKLKVQTVRELTCLQGEYESFTAPVYTFTTKEVKFDILIGSD